MSDDEEISDTEMWREHKLRSQQKRAANRDASAKLLADAGIPFERKNGGAHLVVTGPLGTYDFWPGTGKWCVRGNPVQYRGVARLIERIARERGE